VISVGSLLLACTVKGEDVATTFGDPTANPSGVPPDTMGESDTDETQTADTEPAATDSGQATTMEATTAPSDSDSTGEPGVDEQPASGMYSECTSVADCIGQTTCVIVPGAPMGFCSITGCANAVADCQPNPGATSTAAPACVDDGSGIFVCALNCSGGIACPGGMECLSLGASMVCV